MYTPCNRCQNDIPEDLVACILCGSNPWEGGDGAASALLEFLDNTFLPLPSSAYSMARNMVMFPVTDKSTQKLYWQGTDGQRLYVDEACTIPVNCEPLRVWLHWAMFVSGFWGW